MPYQRGFLPPFYSFVLLLLLLSIFDDGYCEFFCVQGDKVILHNNPDQKSKPLWEYGNGLPVEVLKKQGDWLLVKDFENDSGWVHRSKLQKGKQVIVKANKDENKTINIRSGPNTSNSIVGNAYYGVVFTILDKDGLWLQVRHESGLSGWVKADLLWGL